MPVFTAQIIYKIKTSATGTEQYDEQWRLVYADNERDALEQAREVAKEEEMTFIDRHGRPVSWELIAIKDLQQIELKHGALLFSIVKEVEPLAAPVWAEN